MKFLRTSLVLPLLLLMMETMAQQKAVIRFSTNKIPDGTKLTLMRQWPTRKLVDTSLVRNGQYKFKVNDSFPAVYALSARKPWMYAVVFMEGKDAAVTFNSEEPVVKGSRSQAVMDKFLAAIKPDEEKWREYGNRYGAAKDMEEKLKVGNEMGGISEKVMGSRERFVIEHANELAGIWLAYEQANLWREQALKKMVPLFAKQNRTTALAAMLQQKLDEFESKKMIGSKAPAFTLKDIAGNTVTLDSIVQKNKYVLVDVWASWCAPCRATNRKLAPEYAGLKSMGIELVSISVDEKINEWTKAVAADKIPWLQLVSPEGMKSKVVTDYKVQALPATFLIDNKGVIIRQHIEIADLKKLAAGL